MERAILYISSCLFVLVADLTSKHLAERFIDGEIELLPFLKLVLVYNKGVAFGLFSNAPDWIRIPILLGVPPIAVVFTFFYALRQKDKLLSIALGLIGGGALGNFYDRLFLGEVRDFIYLSYNSFSYPAFNIADAMITLGVGLIFLKSIR
ncbi:signal peptidase II [Thermocrinis sp.]